jgi:hypothetical protein
MVKSWLQWVQKGEAESGIQIGGALTPGHPSSANDDIACSTSSTSASLTTPVAVDGVGVCVDVLDVLDGCAGGVVGALVASSCNSCSPSQFTTCVHLIPFSKAIN